MLKKINFYGIIPHRNICYTLRQTQKNIKTNLLKTNIDAFIFLPIMAITLQEKINTSFTIEKPELFDNWIGCKISNNLQSDFTEETTNSNEDLTIQTIPPIQISNFPPINYTNIIPLIFFEKPLSENQILDIKKILNESDYVKETFNINLKVFRTALFNFTWPLSEENKKKIPSTAKIKYAFNWSVLKTKWHNFNKRKNNQSNSNIPLYN